MTFRIRLPKKLNIVNTGATTRCVYVIVKLVSRLTLRLSMSVDNRTSNQTSLNVNASTISRLFPKSEAQPRMREKPRYCTSIYGILTGFYPCARQKVVKQFSLTTNKCRALPAF